MPSVLTLPPTSPRSSQCHIVDTATTHDNPTNVTDSFENTTMEPKVVAGINGALISATCFHLIPLSAIYKLDIPFSADCVNGKTPTSRIARTPPSSKTDREGTGVQTHGYDST